MITEYLLKKYDCEVPRYTSYPTVPFWQDMQDTGGYIASFTEGFEKYNPTEGISLYIHLPFCESLCTYCGCNKVITTHHGVEEKYLNAVIEEWYRYRKLMPATPRIRELHLGGGTPTFFSPRNLERLLQCIFDLAEIHPEKQFSIEGHPNNTTREHLEMLYRLGFTRLSLGVQDHNPEVQRAINRIQPYENVKRATETARDTGFTSVNYDLIYGLPLQTIASVEKTVTDTLSLRPDRIAYYSYAHIPWKMRAQRLYDEKDLPSPDVKMKCYLAARSRLLSAGYTDIGMDHFALSRDELSKARDEGRLHRNFMGYTTIRSPFMIGLGVSAISDTGSAYAQNAKQLTRYYTRVAGAELPLQRGHLLTEHDRVFRRYIMEIACKKEATFDPTHRELLDTLVMPDLKALAADGLIELDQRHLKVTARGSLFLRNICRAFDIRWKLTRDRENEIRFSKSV